MNLFFNAKYFWCPVSVEVLGQLTVQLMQQRSTFKQDINRLNCVLSVRMIGIFLLGSWLSSAIRYNMRCYFNVCSKADMSRLNLPHGDDN